MNNSPSRENVVLSIEISELKGLHKKVQNFSSRFVGSQEIAKNEVAKVLCDILWNIQDY